MQKLKTLGIYTGAIFLSLIILAWTIQLWNADIKIPFLYGGDSIATGTFIKSIIDNGWYLHNSFIGMPIDGQMYDFPMAENLHFLIIKLITFFANDYASSINIYFILTFPLTTLFSLLAMRQFKISYPIAIVLSVLFTFLPYHFLRGEGHLFLAAYYTIPLMVLVLLWAYSEDILLNKNLDNRSRITINLNIKSLVSILICLLIASAGTYYAFFGCFFLLIIGIMSSIYQKSLHRLIIVLILIGTIIIGLIINISPTIFYQYKNGKNVEVGQRSPIESEIYGLKITQMLLPSDGHRITQLAEKKSEYNAKVPLVNENRMASLGIIGSIGFLILLCLIFWRPPTGSKLQCLSFLNLSAILLSTIGGFGTLFALIISPQIRAYNRISIYIAFFSFLVIAFLLDELNKKCLKIPKGRIVMGVLLIILLAVGIYDQTNASFVPNYDHNAAEFKNDTEFVGEIEKVLAKNSMVFQLPYVPFPENPPVNHMGDYELFRGYLHSDSLRWSYGAMKGREGDLWQREISSKPITDFVRIICLAGFDGIYIDRWGYSDNGNDIEANLSTLLSIKPIISNNGRLVFFNLRDYKQMLRAGYTKETWEIEKEKALHPLLASWQGGFFTMEGTPQENWRWCSKEGELRLINMSDKTKTFMIDMGLATGWPESSQLLLKGDLLNQVLTVSSNPTVYSTKVTVPPGIHKIIFQCDAKRVDATADPRYLVFRIINFKIN